MAKTPQCDILSTVMKPNNNHGNIEVSKQMLTCILYYILNKEQATKMQKMQ